ncbi:hypothetical protein SISSUDRAFT_540726 [Sistotremastrum suecicum HHB10207 ss-3]|uniref:Uncharacterized protein n=1 Tax=Sistotremastrum suecicum HHB10207 ss-3 TaxID=1314776 RepID=A0A166F1A5_9AGAM|nr:hypothetical protein SISSUDRAFT_540726 [Sistotremastrum suecicum HHB10207 ss-3]
MPSDPLTLQHFEFFRGPNPRAAAVFEMYTDLINELGVRPTKLNTWRENGTLIKEIKQAFKRIPPEELATRSYALYLEITHRNDRTFYPSELEIESCLWLVGAEFGGKLLIKSLEEFKGLLRDRLTPMSVTQINAQTLYGAVLATPPHAPPPEHTAWLVFGFCACNELNEGILIYIYQTLIRVCTFAEVDAALESCSMISLMDSKGLKPWRIQLGKELEEVMSTGPKSFLPVWFLKNHLLAEKESVDVAWRLFGYPNCRNAGERSALDSVFRKLLLTPEAKPLELQDALLNGTLYEYASARIEMKSKDRKLYRRLLQRLALRDVSPGMLGY